MGNSINTPMKEKKSRKTEYNLLQKSALYENIQISLDSFFIVLDSL